MHRQELWLNEQSIIFSFSHQVKKLTRGGIGKEKRLCAEGQGRSMHLGHIALRAKLHDGEPVKLGYMGAVDGVVKDWRSSSNACVFCRDYRPMPELDQYDQDDIDDEEVDENVTFEEAQNARLRAEHELDRRDAREGVTGRRQRLPGALEGECGSPSQFYSYFYLVVQSCCQRRLSTARSASASVLA